MNNELKWYHEMGEIFQVEVLRVESDDKGETFFLRATGETKQKNDIFKEEARPEKGKEFSVWRSHEHGHMCGWHLLDH